jgi:hypothetical protein
MDRASFSEVLHFIDGERIASVDGSVLGNIEPATGEALGTIAAGGQAEVDLAVAAATKALPDWANSSADTRGQLLERLAAAIEDHLRVTGTPPHVHAGNSDQQLAALSAASGKNPGHFKMVDAEKRADALLRDQALAAARAGTGLATHHEGMRGTGVVNRPRGRGLAAVTGSIPAPGEHADASEGQHRRQVFNQPRTG